MNYPSAAFRAAAAGEEMKNEGGRGWRCQLVKTATLRPGPPRRHADGQAQLRPDGSDPTMAGRLTAGRCQASSECRRGGRRDSQLMQNAGNRSRHLYIRLLELHSAGLSTVAVGSAGAHSRCRWVEAGLHLRQAFCRL